MNNDSNPLPDDPAGDDITADFMAAASGAGSESGKVHGVPLSGERRTRRRSLISAPVRVRKPGASHGDPEDVSTTLDVSRNGILFVTSQPYAVGADVSVTFPYTSSPVAVQAELAGRIVRVCEMSDGRCSVGISLVASTEEIAKEKEKAHSHAAEAPRSVFYSRSPGSNKPLVLAVDANAATREQLKTYLTAEGYDVIAVKNATEGRDVLNQLTPSLLIAEIEGEDLPGYDLCAHVKSTPRLQAIPVMLLTSSAYPSDYSNAHSLGAVVCMAKPYRQERLGHVVRLLAPPPEEKNRPAPPRRADHKRKPTSGHGSSLHGTSGRASKPSASGKSSFRSRFRLSR